MGIVDIDILLPENDIITFTAKNGEKYSIELFIPAAVGFTIIDNIDKLADIFPQGGGKPRITKDAINIVLTILANICSVQYEFMTREWISANISLPRQALIVFKMANPVLKFLQEQGFLEAARLGQKMPEK